MSWVRKDPDTRVALRKYLLSEFWYTCLPTIVSSTVQTVGAQKILLIEWIDGVRAILERLRIASHIKRSLEKERRSGEGRERNREGEKEGRKSRRKRRKEFPTGTIIYFNLPEFYFSGNVGQGL